MLGVRNMERKPEATFRAGTVSAAVWSNDVTTKEGAQRKVSSVSFEKRYKDKDGEWKTSKSLSSQDVPKALMVLSKAYEHITLKMPEEAA